MRIISNHTCKDCCYFDPDGNYCQVDNNYEPVSPKHSPCRMFTSDSEDYDINSCFTTDFDENEYYEE